LAVRIRFYIDENVPVAVADQLQRRGITAVTVRDLGLLGDTDLNHLRRARREGYVFCTHDADYIEMALTGEPHEGIVFGQQRQHGVGDWVRFLELLYAVYLPEDMANRIEYI
jgi:hypothetical protein